MPDKHNPVIGNTIILVEVAPQEPDDNAKENGCYIVFLPLSSTFVHPF